MRRIALAAALLTAFLAPPAGAAGKNLVDNPSFDETGDEPIPGWRVRKVAAKTRFRTEAGKLVAERKSGESSSADECVQMLYLPPDTLALRVRVTLALECREQGSLGTVPERVFAHQDLLRRLAGALKGDQLVGAIRPRFQAALIDEFQDTDRLQWDIFETLFHRAVHRVFKHDRFRPVAVRHVAHGGVRHLEGAGGCLGRSCRNTVFTRPGLGPR